MSEHFLAPEDSVLKRHYEYAMLHARSEANHSDPGLECPPEDSTLRRHYESAQALQRQDSANISLVAAQSQQPTISGTDISEVSNRPAAILEASRPGPSTRPPAHAHVPSASRAATNVGFMSVLRRLLGGQ